MANIGWIYFSKSHREKVGTILELLKTEGMIDELGIGSVRDAFANNMFPGISTVQTRAKYFFIVPNILWDYQRLTPTQRKNTPITKYLDDREHKLMWHLADKYKDVSNSGVIGITKKNRERIVRRPSAIYWNGLTKFGIMDNNGLGVDTYLRSRTRNQAESLISKIAIADDDQGDDHHYDFENHLNIKIKPCSLDWLEGIDMELSWEEADILSRKIMESCKGTLLAELLQNEALYKLFSDSGDFMEFAHNSINMEMPSSITRTITLAQDFSEMMYGAHIAYNVWIQFAKYKEWDSIDFIEDWEKWKSALKTNMIDLPGYDAAQALSPPFGFMAKNFTKTYIAEWSKQIKNGDSDIKKTIEIIRIQEWNNKRNRSRIHAKQLEDIRENSWVGLQRLDYRFRNVKTILKDIKKGLSTNA